MFLIATSCNQAGKNEVSSSDGNLTIRIDVKDTFCYSLDFHGSELIRKAQLGFILEEGQAFAEGLKCVEQRHKTVHESFELPFGKRKKVKDHYNQLLLTLQERKDIQMKSDEMFSNWTKR